MKFIYKDFSCAVDIFSKEKDILIRFYDASREPDERDIFNLVIVDSGFGYLLLKYKGDSGLLSGYLDEHIFLSDEMVDAAIDFIESLSPFSSSAYIPHHIDRVKLTSYVEYNGEY